MSKILLSSFVVICLLFFPGQAWAVKVVVDPGHGGADPGAIGVNSLLEKTVNDDISKKLGVDLKLRGYDVVMTRSTDRTMSLQERVEFANQANADFFVSIHANSYPSSSAVQGAMVLYYDHRYPQSRYPASQEMIKHSSASRQLASHVLESVVKQTGLQNRGLMQSSAYVIRSGTMPSILVETAFLSNAQDADRLADDSFRSRIALGIADGIASGIESLRPAGFADIRGHWALDSIVRLKHLGIVEGRSEKHFEPNQPVTRAELISLLDRVFAFSAKAPAAATVIYPTDDSGTASAGEEVIIDYIAELDENKIISAAINDIQWDGSQNPAADAPFPDLTEAHWAYGSMRTAFALGYVKGYEDGAVRPNHPVTRAEAAVLLNRIINGEEEETRLAASDFLDVQPQSWYAQAIMRLKLQQIIFGQPDNHYHPDKRLTRAEIASLLDRYMLTQALSAL